MPGQGLREGGSERGATEKEMARRSTAVPKARASQKEDEREEEERASSWFFGRFFQRLISRRDKRALFSVGSPVCLRSLPLA